MRGLKMLVGLLLGAVMTTACAASDVDDAPPVDSTDDDFTLLQSAPLEESDMKPVATPKGMPKPYDQPDSTGWFGEHGYCGPTAVANTLLLYWEGDVTPQEAYDDGVHFLIGTMGTQIVNYMSKYHPELGCSIQHPDNGAAFLRQQIDGGHPVMVWFNMAPGPDSHWVVAVGHQGTGAAEQVIVMSWGRYYAIPMSKLVAAWKEVYGLKSPSVVCADKTTLIH